LPDGTAAKGLAMMGERAPSFRAFNLAHAIILLTLISVAAAVFPHLT